MKKALITGITGQDGAYLAKFLLKKEYEVYGLVRHSSTKNFERLEYLNIKDKIKLYEADLLDQSSLINLIGVIQPNEIYNLAAQSFVPISWDQPVLTSEITALGVTRLLEAIKLVNTKIKFFQASSSEMFGKVKEEPQNEKTPFWPRSPYGVSKVYAHFMTINYRESYNLFACCGIMFNHESPLRGKEFVSRKITNAVAKIYFGLEKELVLGNLEVERDWGFAGDYVEAMWLMLQQDNPDDYVIATGQKHTIKDLIETAFNFVKLNSEKYIKSDTEFYRPAEVNTLLGDYSKAYNKFGWKSKTTFEELIIMMLQADILRLELS